MKASVFHDLGDFRTEEREVPEIGLGEVLVQVKTCGVCGTDIHKAVTRSVPTPIVLGHELAGVIVKTGPGVRDFQVGDRVYVAHHVPCFTCHHCRRGHHTLCPQFKETNIDPGGFAEYIRVPVENTRHSMGLIPDDMPFEVAALVEPVACCVRGVNRLDLQTGDTVLIMGAGSIGLIHAQIVKARGAGTVIITDLSGRKLEIAREFGIDVTVNPNEQDLAQVMREVTHGMGPDKVIVAVGVPFLFTQAVELVARGGTVLGFAANSVKDVAPVQVGRLFTDEIAIVGSYSSTPFEYPEALDLLHRGLVDARRMITHRMTLDQLGEAIEKGHRAEDNLKIMIEMSPGAGAEVGHSPSAKSPAGEVVS